MSELAPQARPKRFPGLVPWLLVLLTLLAVVGAWFALHPVFPWAPSGTQWAGAMPKDEFERRVRAYLLEHPEIIAEAISRLESQHAAREATEVQAVLNARADEVFRDPDSPVGGNPNGDVTLVEFFDYNCPYCRQMVPVMAQAETADPQLRVVYKEFPILGPNSTLAAKTALAAHKQGKYLAFHRALFQVRGAIDASKITEVAATVGLDAERLKADMADPMIAALIEKNLALARALRIDGTPGFVAGSQILRGAIDLKALQAFIREARGSR